MKQNRVEQHLIKKNHPLWNLVDEYSFKAKNLYNYANYIVRQEFIKNGKYLDSFYLNKEIKHHEPFLDITSACAQCIIRLLDKNWKSYFQGIKVYKKNPKKFLGRPKIPKYKNKDGRFIFMMKNLQAKVVDNELIFRFKPFRKLCLEKDIHFYTKSKGRLIQLRFKPMGTCYVMEIVYEVEVQKTQKEIKRVIGIDLGLNNLTTITNNIGLQPIIVNGRIIKSINNFYNKQVSKYQSILNKRNKMYNSNKLDHITQKRFNRLKSYFHKTTRFIINYCLQHDIDTIIIGYNEGWKQNINIGHENNQKFVDISFLTILKQLEYKSLDSNINLIKTEESFTSGCSFLDDEPLTREYYNKKRRIKRGLFKSNEGKLINSDINGSFNIIKKVIPNGFNSNGIKGVSLHPVVIAV